MLVPLNTRMKGSEAGYILEKSGARILCTVTGFLDTDYVALLRDVLGGASAGRPISGLPHLERIILLRGTEAATTPWSDFLSEGEAVTAQEAAAARRRPSRPTTSRTSSSPPEPRENRRA